MWVVVVVVAGSGGCAAAAQLPCLYTFWCSIFYFIASAASSSTCDMCLRFQGCPVLLDIELSVSARYQKTRVPLRARRLLLLFVAAASGTNFKITCNESKEK